MKRKLYRKKIIWLGALFLFFTLFPSHFSLAAELDLVWPAPIIYDIDATDVARDIVADNNGIYIVGEVAETGCCVSGTQWRIEKRNSVDGSLTAPAWEKSSNPGGINIKDGAYAIAADDLYLYIVGFEGTLRDSKWRIEKRSIIDGSLMSSYSFDPSLTISSDDKVTGIAIDSTYMYIVGTDMSPGLLNSQWRIEKRNLSDLALVGSAVTENPSSYTDNLNGIDIDENYMYIVGSDQPVYRNERWRIEKRNLSDLALVGSAAIVNPTNYDDAPFSIEEYDGNIYIAGYQSPSDIRDDPEDKRWLIISRKTSDITSSNWSQFENISSYNDRAYSVSVDSTGVYIAGFDNANSCLSSGNWRFEKRSLSSGNLDAYLSETISGSLAGTTNIPFGTFVIGDSFYIAGAQNYDGCGCGCGDAKWRVEKRGKASPVVPHIEILPSDFSLGTPRDLEVWIRDAVPVGQEITFEKSGANPEKFYLDNTSCIVDSSGYCKVTVSAIDWDDYYTATITAKYDIGGYTPAFSTGEIVKIPQCSISCPPSFDVYSSANNEYNISVTGNDPGCTLLSCSKFEGSSDVEIEMLDEDTCAVNVLNNARYGTATARSQSSDSKICETQINIKPRGWIEMSP